MAAVYLDTWDRSATRWQCRNRLHLHIILQGRGFLTGTIKKFEDIPEQQRHSNPRMSEEDNFNKV